MPTAEKTIELTGEAALESNVSQHGGDPKSFRIFRDLITDVAKRIVKRDGKGASKGSVNGIEPQVIHEFVYVDISSGSEEYFVLAAIDGGAYIYLWNGATTWAGQSLPITPTGGGKWFFCNADNRVFACNGKDALLVGSRTGAGTLTWKTAGVDAPSFAPTYSLSTTNPPVTNSSTGTTVSATQGLATVTNSGTSFVTGGAWNGKRIVINGNAYTISVVGSTSSLTITENFKEVTSPGLTWSVYPGVADWDNGPKYAFSYYNPTTGHCSLASPVVEVTEQNQFGRTPVVTIAGSAENTTAYTNGYTQIQLFRTAKNSGILVALNEKLNNNNTASAITFTETAAKFADTFLTDLERPLLNYRPPSGLGALAFHQGRVWGYHVPTGATRYTPISVEVDLGKSVESWPPLYKLDIQAIPRGLVVVGGSSSADALIIQSSRGDWSVDGFDSISFTPYRVKTRQSGGNLFSATSVDGDLVEFYQDKRLMAMRQDIGRAIQDKLSLVRDSLITKARLHWFAAKTTNYLLLSVPKNGSSTTNDYTYVWDLDREDATPIYEWNFGSSAYGTIHDVSTGALQLFAGDSSGVVYQLLSGSNQDAGSNFAPTLRTSLFRFDEEHQRIKYIKLFVNDAQITSGDATGWSGVLYINEQTNAGATDGTAIALPFRRSSYRDESAQGKELIWTPTTSLRSKAKVFQIDVTFPSVNGPLWIEKIVIAFTFAQDIGEQS